MALEKQFSIFVQNKVGSLRVLCKELAREGINIRAISVVDDLEWGIVRLIVDSDDRTRTILQDLDMMYGESQVLTVELSNHPGALADLADKLLTGNINIEQAYATAVGDNTIVVLSTTDDKRANSALSE